MNLDTIREALTAQYAPWERLTLADRFDRLTERYGDRPLIMTQERDWSFSDVAQASEQLAAGLMALGIRRREHVAVILANYPEYVVLQIALARIGAVAVPLNYALKADENAYLLGQSDAVCLITMDYYRDQDYLTQLDEIAPGWREGRQDALPRLREVVIFPTRDEDANAHQSYASVLEMGSRVSRVEVSQRQRESAYPDEVVNILYTSGTTNLPKGVMLTHDMLWRSAMATAYGRGHRDGSRLFFSMPLYHVFAYVEGLLGAMLVGGAVITQIRFVPDEALRLMSEKRATEALLVPTILQELLRRPEVSKLDFSALTSIFCASSPAPVGLWEQAKVAFDLGEVHTGYGMTEVAAATVSTRSGDPVDVVTSRVGAVLPGGPGGLREFQGANTEYKTVDPTTGEDLPRGVEGELACRGNIVTTGYYNKPLETAETLDKDGWLRTGDLGRIHSDGLLELTGRSKDLYKLNGENIIPREIEELLSTHDAVEQAFVVGVPDELSGEVGVAFVTLRQGGSVEAEELRSFVRERLSRHKVPYAVYFLGSDELPLTASGKIQKFRLRERAMKALGRSELGAKMTGGG